MVTTLENHHIGTQRKIRNMTNDTITEDSFKVFFGHDIITTTTLASIMTRDVITMDHTKTAYDAALSS